MWTAKKPERYHFLSKEQSWVFGKLKLQNVFENWKVKCKLSLNILSYKQRNSFLICYNIFNFSLLYFKNKRNLKNGFS